jgi:uncharacterized protein (TIGR00730 family)
MRSVLVFCGASKGQDPAYAEVARALGRSLAEAGKTIVYGGGNVGLMGELANAALAAGGQVTGVITEHLLEREVCHRGLSELHVVKTMHERKVLMARLSDAVITLAGGYGTLDELFELLTLGQLGHDHRPIGILNTRGFYDHLLAHLDHALTEGFLRAQHRDLLIVEQELPVLLERMEAYHPAPDVPKWL